MTTPVVFRTLDVATPDGPADAYLARPGDGAPHPGVLLFMDAFGLRPRIREMAETIAAHGYTVLAPNVFHRAGRAPVVPLPDLTDDAARGAFFGVIGPILRGVDSADAMRDAGAFLDWLAASDDVADGPVGVTGYCMGGRLALRTAGAFPDRVAAAASFHGGRLAEDDAPDSPHHAAAAITAELYLGHAENDASMPADRIRHLTETLDTAGVRHTSEVYAGARHGFTMADTASHDPAAEARHWDALLALLDRTLKPAA